MKIKLRIAKDDDGKVYIYSKEPTCKVNGCWGGVDERNMALVPNEIDGDLQEVELEID